MLPVSSATTSCSCHGQIHVYGGLKTFSSYPKAFDCSNVNKSVKKFSRRRGVTCFYSNYIAKDEQCSSISTINHSLYQSGCSTQFGVSDEIRDLGPNLVFVNSSSESSTNFQLPEFISKPFDPDLVSDSLIVDVNPLSVLNTQFTDIVEGGEDLLNNSVDSITSSLNAALTSGNEAVDKVINEINTFLHQTGDSAGDKLSGLSSGVKEGSGAVGSVALDVLRRTVVTVEGLVKFGTKNIGYGYDSAKEFLPREYQDVLRLSEGRVTETLSPIGAAFQQVYVALEGFEERLGLDPNDPLIPVVLVFGVSAILWGSYRVFKYSGYAGDISPESAMELLRGNDSSVLIDIRPENLRDRDGIPDLRRRARSRYASIALPEVDSSIKKMLKGGRDLEDSLLAVVIRDLKIVKDRSKVLVMDADGTRSKSVARSLKKLGAKRPYQVLGGFQSWVNEGCRVKELKPETTFTILNEEAEAILEEIKPTPLKVIGFGVGVAAAGYALLGKFLHNFSFDEHRTIICLYEFPFASPRLASPPWMATAEFASSDLQQKAYNLGFAEWETTLQFIAVIGIGQTIFQRIASYQGAQDFQQDLRFLLAPVSLGGQAISWAAGKLETNRNGLPTSPSSSDVQSRVLQAAAKLESQPPESTETQDMPQVSGNEEVNISEA